MSKREVILLLASTFLLSMLVACEKSEDKSKDTTTETTNGNGDSDSNSLDHESASDYVWDATKVIHITLNGSSISVDSTGVTSINGSTITITRAATYSISGSLTDGQIIVNTSDSSIVRLILNGVNINSSTSAPIYISKSKKAIIVLGENTNNNVTDATTYVFASSTDDEPNAAIYSKSPLSLYGSGSLTVTGNYNDGITSKDGLIIKSGTIIVNSADDGIRGKDYIIVRGGNTTVISKGDGLKSDNDENTSMGFISVETGTLNITSGGDGIAAQTNVEITDGEVAITSGGGSSNSKNESISAKGIKGLAGITIGGKNITISSADDAIHTNGTVKIDGGTINLSTSDDGIHAETAIAINTGNINITKSYEGIESPTITVKDGNISVVASNDGFNASKGLTAGGTESNDGSILNINGGYIVVNVSNGDGIDSNGSIAMTGGTVIVHGPQSSPEVALDYNGTFNISGGMLVAAGPNSGNMIQGLSTSSTQYSLKIILTSSAAANTLFHIQDESGNDIFTFQPVRGFNYIVFSSPSLKNGSTYHIYTGGSSTGTAKNGLYEGGTYTPGTSYANFTISSIVTSLGSSSQGPTRP